MDNHIPPVQVSLPNSPPADNIALGDEGSVQSQDTHAIHVDQPVQQGTERDRPQPHPSVEESIPEASSNHVHPVTHIPSNSGSTVEPPTSPAPHEVNGNAPTSSRMSHTASDGTVGQRARDTEASNSTGLTSPAFSSHRRSLTIGNRGNSVSVVLISSALETIASSKEAKRSTTLRESTQHALELIRNDQGGDRPREVFEPLRLACETRNDKLMIASLDCISKLISYSFFAEPPSNQLNYSSPPPSPGLSGKPSTENSSSLVDLVTNTIAACHSETTPEAVSLQIVKALLALVLSPTIFVHHSSLLKAVRTVYNVFLLSTDPVNQMVAQGGLTQMVHHVFTRCRAPTGVKNPATEGLSHSPSQDSFPSPKSATFSLPTGSKTSFTISEEIQKTDRSWPAPDPLEKRDSAVAEAEQTGQAFSSEEKGARASHESFVESNLRGPTPEVNGHRQLTRTDLFIKDAFLVFRALCKLTMKPLNNESERDMKSHAMRSKLLSLHLVLTVLNSHMPLFVDSTALIYSSSSNEATTFVQAIKQFLCLAMSRNAISQVPQVFEIVVEIIWRVLSGMRTKLKKEIEVLLHEIFIPILEMRTSTVKQKAVILGMLSRLCQDPQALVEIYLNYDCDGQSADNIYEHLMNVISKIGTTPSVLTGTKANEPPSPAIQPATKSSGNVPHSLSTTAMSVSGSMDTSMMGQSEAHLRRQGLECLVTVLRSLVAWGTAAEKTADDSTLVASSSTPSQTGEDLRRNSLTPDPSLDKVSTDPSTETLRQSTPELEDDPSRFESAKQKKTALLEGIKKFNFKPKRGIQFLIETGFIPSKSPQDIAKFLLNTDGLGKAMIGEYLGEGEEENIAIMHAFVDLLDFTNLPFVDALRLFLQSFRLPGESQKIDRYMLKFAERFIAGNSQTPFANADAAYVLAYSTILLNTDAHNPQIKKRMTKPDFIKNNRGINDNADLPEEFLSAIYDEIVNNEIKMKDEVGRTASATGPGLASVLANMGRDLQKEAYVMQSSGMANKTEALFRTMMRTQRKGSKSGEQFFSASHFVHVRPMFEVAWIAFLAGLSGPLQDTDDFEIVELCLDGFKSAIRIVCFFDLELERNARVRKLPTEELANESRSTHITVAADMVFSLSHYLSGTAIVDFVQALSDVSWEEIQSSGLSQHPRLFSLQKLVEISYYNMNRIRLEWSNLWGILGKHFNQVCCHNNLHVASFALDSLRQLATRFLEKEELPHFKFQKDFLKPFEHTMIHNSNPDIRDLVLQCLQQMIQTRVQNMRSGWRTMFGVFQAASKVLTERIANSAFEIVTRLNKEHFNAIVRHGAFADLTVCVTDFCKSSKYQKISLLAIGMLRGIIPVMLDCPECGWSTESLDDNMIKYWYPILFAFYEIIMNGEDLEVRRLALDSLFTTLKTYGSTFPVDFWDTCCQELLFPIFSVLKSSQDLSRFSTQEDMSVWLSTTMIQALRDLIDLYTFFFTTLERFLDGLLDLLCVCICQENDTLARIGTSCLQQLLENNVSKLSPVRWERVVTTFVKLFKTTTPHQLFDDALRVQISDHNSPELGDPNEANGQAILPAPLSSGNEPTKSGVQHTVDDRRRIFKQIIVKCVLQLLLIETTNDLLRNDEVYNTIPPDQLLRLTSVLDQSYQFARMFNEDKELRTGLWKVGFMRHLPNLLKQESSSAATLVHVLSRMYYDLRPEHQSARGQIAERLMPLSLNVIRDFNKLRADSQNKNILAWTPVVADILDGFCRFDDKAFARYLPAIYPLAAELLVRELTPDIRQSLKTYFIRVGFAQRIIEPS
ncbi:hypothetical protein E1B28_004386 [Marasmius oreades]|uniref:SEC7 domain-containing protein n=1 Tax=Marasmius oreades TaxID=181124 RepID=A0A9P7UYL6_9AGAR|nr:uncharacterized protein E1B28_004386 [Marasmius oreades]KAG7096991.1 hypothetical protein E1B28_004386 [Marasmius oreades]